MKQNILAIIIPAYNEGTVIEKVIRSLPAKIEGISKISVIVVDDGSKDNTSAQAKKCKDTIVLTQKMNLGVGGATYTGLKAALKIGATVAVTIDGDGQHEPSDIAKVILPIIQKRTNIVIGNRFMSLQNIPVQRVILNRLGSFLTYLLYGVKINDSQTGFRAYDREALSLMKITSNGYEYNSEFIGEAKRHKLSFIEVPIKVNYTKYSMSKGQHFTRSFDMAANLIFNAFRRIK